MEKREKKQKIRKGQNGKQQQTQKHSWTQQLDPNLT